MEGGDPLMKLTPVESILDLVLDVASDTEGLRPLRRDAFLELRIVHPPDDSRLIEAQAASKE